MDQRLNAVKASMEQSRKNTEAAVNAQLDKVKADLNVGKSEVESAKAKIHAYINDKKAETESKIQEWKTNREIDKLEKRADKAEQNAAHCILLAIAAVDEAEVGILEAVAVRREADEAQLATA